MPINLVTGLPGHGKTLYTLAKWREVAEKEGRTVFQHGINGLKLPWPAWEPQRWRELEPGSIFIIDEAWQVFPVRGRGEPPEWVGELAKHRHLGIDFVLVTQDPMLVDVFVRRLVDRHFHVVRKFGTRFATIHEFPNGVKEQVSKSREGSIRHEWRYPAELFSLYHSAEMHTVRRRIPARVWLLFCIPFLLAAVVWFIVQRLNPAATAERVAGAPIAAPGGGSVGAAAGGPGAGRGSARLSTDEYLGQYTPRVRDLAYTSPVFDEVTRPTEAPYPAACVSKGDDCRCYSQQGTRLQVSASFCRDVVRDGFFVPWRQSVSWSRPPEDRREPVQAALGGAIGIGSVPEPRSEAPGAPEASDRPPQRRR